MIELELRLKLHSFVGIYSKTRHQSGCGEASSSHNGERTGDPPPLIRAVVAPFLWHDQTVCVQGNSHDDGSGGRCGRETYLAVVAPPVEANGRRPDDGSPTTFSGCARRRICSSASVAANHQVTTQTPSASSRERGHSLDYGTGGGRDDCTYPCGRACASACKPCCT